MSVKTEKVGPRTRRTGQTRRKAARQTVMVFRTWGGRRAGAGAKPRPENIGLQPHVARPEFVARTPIHATMSVRRGLPSLRSQRLFAIVESELRRGSDKGFRVLHFSVQTDHVRLIAEGDDGTAFSRGMQRLGSRVARRINLEVRRRGVFWRERYFRRDLATPRQFKNALVYVLCNFKKRGESPAERERRKRMLDGCSSAFWFEGWAPQFDIHALARAARAGPSPVVAAESWIARVGWKRHGLVAPDAIPRFERA